MHLQCTMKIDRQTNTFQMWNVNEFFHVKNHEIAIAMLKNLAEVLQKNMTCKEIDGHPTTLTNKEIFEIIRLKASQIARIAKDNCYEKKEIFYVLFERGTHIERICNLMKSIENYAIDGIMKLPSELLVSIVELTDIKSFNQLKSTSHYLKSLLLAFPERNLQTTILAEQYKIKQLHLERSREADAHFLFSNPYS